MDSKIASKHGRNFAFGILSSTLLVGVLVFVFERDYWRKNITLQSRQTVRTVQQDLNYRVQLLQQVALRCARGATGRDIVADTVGELVRHPATHALACYTPDRFTRILPAPADLPQFAGDPDPLLRWATTAPGTDLVWLNAPQPSRPTMVIRVRAPSAIPKQPMFALLLLDIPHWLNITLASAEQIDAQGVSLWYQQPFFSDQILLRAPSQRGIWPEAATVDPISVVDSRWVLRIQFSSRWAQYRGSLLVLLSGIMLAGIWLNRARDMMRLDRLAYATFVQSLSEMDLGLVSIEQQRIRYVNSRLCDLTGYAADELFDLPKFIFLFHPEERQRIMRNHLRRLAGDTFASHYDTALQTRDGRRIDVEMSVARLKLGDRVVVMLLLRDISARKLAEAALLKHHQQLQSLVEAAPLPLVLTRLSDKAVLFTNHHASALFKVPMSEAGKYRSVEFLVDDAARRDIRAQLRVRGMLSDYEVRYRDTSGRIFWAMISAQTLSYAGQPCVLVAINDITARREMQQQMEFLAHHDAMTNLPNRRLLLDSLQHQIIQADQSGGMVALLYLDLDGFKPINDQLGHENGDRALRLVADRFKSCLRSTDVLARIGGDEFCVLIPAIHEPEEAAGAAQKLLECLHAPLVIGDQPVQVGVSIGIAIYPQDGHDPWTLLRAADDAMYEVKALGKNHHRRCGPATGRAVDT